MKKFLALMMLLASVTAQAQDKLKPFAFELASISVAQVVQLIYSEAMTTPYVLDPEVLNDTRLVSFRYKDSRGELREFLSSFLSRLGYAVERRGGVDFVFKRPEGSGQTADDQGFIYRPQYRDVAYISRVLAPLFKGSFAVNRSVRASEGSRPEGNVPPTSAAALIDQDASVLVFSGAQAEVERLRTMLPLVDTPVGEVSVRGVVYEVSNIDRKGSAFGLLSPSAPKEGKKGIDICLSPQGRQAGDLATFAHAEVLDHVLVSCTMGVRYGCGQFQAQPGGFGQDRLGIG